MSTTVRIQVTVDIHVGTWGGECLMRQLHEQAGREGKTILHNLLASKDGKIIGEPKVIFTTTER